MIVADLHSHTTNSDGTLTLPTLPDAARAADIEVVAVTDHDRTHPGLDAPVVDLDGITVVHGIEMKVEPDAGERVDLLAYGLTRTDALDSLVDRIQTARVQRGRDMVANVERHLDVDLGLSVERGFGRPDLARAVIAHPDTKYDPDGPLDPVFSDLIGDDGPCFVRRWVPSFEQGFEVLDDAAAIVGLAHPLRYRDPEAALALTSDLDAVELHYPYGGDPDRSAVEAAIDEYDLLVTGGSDAHDRELGTAGLDAEEWAQVHERLV